MRWKEHGFLLVLAVCGISLVTGGCAKLRARDKLNKGVYAFRSGQFDESIEELKRASTLAPIRVDIRIDLALTLTMLGEYEDARSQFEEVLRREPNNKRALDSLVFLSDPA